jgi:hypothetical protein
MQITKHKKNPLDEIKSFTYPDLHTGKEWCISFYAFNPARNEMRRKRIKLNHIKKIGDRRKYVNRLLKRLVTKLEKVIKLMIEVGTFIKDDTSSIEMVAISDTLQAISAEVT